MKTNYIAIPLVCILSACAGKFPKVEVTAMCEATQSLAFQHPDIKCGFKVEAVVMQIGPFNYVKDIPEEH